MEFVAKYVDQVSPGAQASTASMVAFKASILDASAALKTFSGAAPPAAAGAADAGKAAGAAGRSADAYASALDRLAGRAAAVRERFANLSPVKEAGKLFDAVGARVGAAKDKISGALAAAVAPAGRAFDAVRGKAGELAAKVADSKPYRLAADVGTVASGLLGKGFDGAKGRLGGLLSKLTDKSPYQGAAAGAATMGKGLSVAGVAAGNLYAKLLQVAAAKVQEAAVALAPLALGYQGMQRLAALSYKARLDLRQLFVGVDASPAIRAAQRYELNLSKSTVTGKVLGDVLTRSFNGIFAALEKAEPYITAFSQGLLYGFLLAENAVLKARLGFVPLEAQLDAMVGKGQLLKVAFYGGVIVMGAVALVAVAAAAAFVGLGLAIEKVIGLYNEFTGNTDTLQKVQGRHGKGATEVAGAPPGAPTPAAGAGAGKAAGNALGDGLVTGMLEKLGAVEAAGKLLGKAADNGVKSEAEIKSPSKKMKRNARYMGEGVEEGLEESAPGVQRAAAKALVPSGGGGAGAGLKSGGGAAARLVAAHFHFPNITSGEPGAIEAALHVFLEQELEGVLVQLGVAPGGG